MGAEFYYHLITATPPLGSPYPSGNISIPGKALINSYTAKPKVNSASKGASNIPKQTLTSNKGKIIDVTPTSSHTTTTSVPNPKNGTSNSSVDIINKHSGEILTRRWYGSNGKAIRDVDYSHHKNPKLIRKLHTNIHGLMIKMAIQVGVSKGVIKFGV
jgi:hypothetical protein